MSVTSNKIARRIDVNGIVQGVGFRPFVYQLACRNGLTGDVANTSEGVRIHVEGLPAAIDHFYQELESCPPPLAKITEITMRSAVLRNAESFRIEKSASQEKTATLISPDVSVCADCLREMMDPQDRRYRYPFINCTNCGPRYTIIDNIPYDRPYTSMKHFTMCPDCQAEYDDPGNRRFHAQPNACPVCGPQVSLHDHMGNRVDGDDPVVQTTELLKHGFILAIKGLGGFHLAADAENTQAVQKLRQRKHREEKPFALMALDIKNIQTFCQIQSEEQTLLTSAQRPIVLLRKKEPNSISPAVAPNNKYFGVMLPYTPLHYLLLDRGFTALVMTSGNMSEEPIAIDNADAFQRLGSIADYFLIHNRDIYLRSDDSIVRYTAGQPRYIRRSRGYVPMPVFLKHRLPSVLAVGAHLKNTICITRNNEAFLSQHIGDLENAPTEAFFQMTIDHMKRILDIEPDCIAHDMHPAYLSTQYALAQTDIPTIAVQHHHAHIVSCMAENQVDAPVIGLSMDGTGYGVDGTVWGGEILICRMTDFQRIGYFDPVPMPGGEAAIREPWRMAISYLYSIWKDEFRNLNLALFNTVGWDKTDFVVQMIQKAVNCPLTSSLGRLFDGVSAMVGLHHRVSFEGQAAMALEMIANDSWDTIYDMRWNDTADGISIQIGSLIEGVVRDIEHGIPVPAIASRFHGSLVHGLTRICETIRKQTGIDTVALSGGVFQNSLLFNGLLRRLTSSGFTVLSHNTVPTNDGGISLGQAVIAGIQVR